MKKIFVTLSSLFVFCILSVPAFAQNVQLGGQVVGVELSTRGVLVAGISDVETIDGTVSPASEAGIECGDIIISVNGETADSASQIIDCLSRAHGESLELGIERQERSLSFSVRPALSNDGQWMLGLWLRDGLCGIGTLTFYEPDSGVFGALGHGVNDNEHHLVPISEGSITQAQVVSVEPGSSGTPGVLNGCADLGCELGSIVQNSVCGIFGLAYESLGGRTIETGFIAAGPASIVSTVSGSETREFSVEINKIISDADGTHATLSVTDPVLLSLTGGIVQGMSGSPIIQDGKLVGAVTHVYVSDPTRGYAVSIQDMLREAGLEEQAA